MVAALDDQVPVLVAVVLVAHTEPFGTAVADFRKSPDSISETPQADEPRTGRTSLAA